MLIDGAPVFWQARKFLFRTFRGAGVLVVTVICIWFAIHGSPLDDPRSAVWLAVAAVLLRVGQLSAEGVVAATSEFASLATAALASSTAASAISGISAATRALVVVAAVTAFFDAIPYSQFRELRAEWEAAVDRGESGVTEKRDARIAYSAAISLRGFAAGAGASAVVLALLPGSIALEAVVAVLAFLVIAYAVMRRQGVDLADQIP